MLRYLNFVRNVYLEHRSDLESPSADAADGTLGACSAGAFWYFLAVQKVR
ncbi:MAG: hypothetical protein RR234_04300 [Christensenella sp.]